MIEALVKYIEDQGFTVRISRGHIKGWGVIMISKTVGERLVRVNWALSDIKLKAAHYGTLRAEADQYLSTLREAIALQNNMPK